ncbi:MAG: sugar phosphate nucleotidyltransferase [Gemmataceae bacterium]
MQAVILAGGLGTRLGDITKAVPKPMVSVAGKPYLEHQLAELRRQGVTDIALLTGYLGEQVEAYFGDGGRFGLTIRYSRETTPLGTGGALRDAAGILADEFLLIYGDSYLPIDYPAVLRHLATDAAAVGVAVVYDNREATTVPNNIALDAGYVVRYAKDAAQTPDLAYVEAGVLAFRRGVLDELPAAGPASLEKDAFPPLIARRRLLGHVTRQRFYDIGTPERLRAIEELFSHR